MNKLLNGRGSRRITIQFIKSLKTSKTKYSIVWNYTRGTWWESGEQNLLLERRTGWRRHKLSSRSPYLSSTLDTSYKIFLTSTQYSIKTKINWSFQSFSPATETMKTFFKERNGPQDWRSTTHTSVLTNCPPVAHRKQFFFFLPALQTFTMLSRRSSLGVKISLCSACLMAVIFPQLKNI